MTDPEIYDALAQTEPKRPQCKHYEYARVELHTHGDRYAVAHWCHLIDEICGLFPPRCCPSAWAPQCWGDGEILT